MTFYRDPPLSDSPEGLGTNAALDAAHEHGEFTLLGPAARAILWRHAPWLIYWQYKPLPFKGNPQAPYAPAWAEYLAAPTDVPGPVRGAAIAWILRQGPAGAAMARDLWLEGSLDTLARAAYGGGKSMLAAAKKRRR